MTDTRTYLVVLWRTHFGSMEAEHFDTEDRAIEEYDDPIRGWEYAHCWHVSADSTGRLQANEFDLPGASRDAERQRNEGMAELREGPRYTMNARFRP